MWSAPLLIRLKKVCLVKDAAHGPRVDCHSGEHLADAVHDALGRPTGTEGQCNERYAKSFFMFLLRLFLPIMFGVS